jgi:hypothetical protein
MKKYKNRLIAILILYLFVCIIVNFQNEVFSYLFKEKTWVHRVNSIEKLKEVNSIFNGIELDVVFNNETKIFDVNHPPTKSINLSLRKYLASLNLNSNNRFWLDFKNLEEKNCINACLKLDTLCQEFSINKNRLIIESGNPQFLEVFYKKGYKTSYYLPSNLVGLSESELKEKLKSINSIVLKNKTTYLSTDKRDYSIVKKYFPKHKLLIWAFYFFDKKTINPYHILYGLNNIYHKFRVLPNNNVSVALFRYESAIGNR